MPTKKYKLVKSMVFVFGQLWELLRAYRGKFLISVLLVAAMEFSALLAQYFFKDIVDLLGLGAAMSLHRLYWLIGAMVIVYSADSVIDYVNDLHTVRYIIKAEHELSLRVYQKMLQLSLGYHERENTGAKLRKIDKGVDQVRAFMESIVWNITPVLFRGIGSFGFLLFIDYRMAFAFISVVPLFFILTYVMNVRAYPMRRGIWRGFEKVYGNFGEVIYNVKTVQAFAQETREQNKAQSGIIELIKKQFSYVQLLFTFGFLRNNIITLGNIIVICSGVYLAYHGQITPGSLVLFLMVSGNTYYSFFNLSRVFDQVMESKVGIERIMEVMNSEVDLKQSSTPISLKIKGAVEFRNVSFSYIVKKGKKLKQSKESVLHKLNFKIKPGETIAVVGPSGGGKTTIAKLIYRYFDTSKGQILIDGEDIRNLDLQHYRAQIGLVSQDIDIFNSTVKENIAYGNPKASMAEIREAARVANAEEFIDKLTKKYNTIVGERGIKLSGGQKQRLGIARAILIDPKILIFDEATSSLDATSEKMIQDAIEKVIQHRTTIVIAHRLSTIKNADRILVIDKGEVVEQGTHEQLMRRDDGHYAKLINLQTAGYLE